MAMSSVTEQKIVNKDQPPGRNWASIASLNVSKRRKTNTLEVRLENELKSGCTLNSQEMEKLL